MHSQSLCVVASRAECRMNNNGNHLLYITNQCMPQGQYINQSMHELGTVLLHQPINAWLRGGAIHQPINVWTGYSTSTNQCLLSKKILSKKNSKQKNSKQKKF